jgi:GT2 family glycosyltransferase
MVNWKSHSNGASEDIIVIIPTLDRHELLIELLFSLTSSTVLPIATYIVDSSDISVDLEEKYKNIRLKYLKSHIKSAASQRNQAIEFALTQELDFGFVAFLDDDVRIYDTYFEDLLKRFRENPDFVGISGLAVGISNKDRDRSVWSDFLGLTGEAGSLTKALVNVSPAKIEKFKEVNWLIGCAMWKKIVIENIRFEEDFRGQSLFEDVIFSFKGREWGKIGVDPQIKFQHLLSQLGRPSERIHYEAWVHNRYRLFSYSKDEFSKLAFWRLNLILLIITSFRAIVNHRERDKVLGILRGIFRVFLDVVAK